MPELPEVEVVRAGLARHVAGRTVTRVEILDPRPLRRQDGERRPSSTSSPGAP